jgi:hypothetical protein
LYLVEVVGMLDQAPQAVSGPTVPDLDGVTAAGQEIPVRGKRDAVRDAADALQTQLPPEASGVVTRFPSGEKATERRSDDHRESSRWNNSWPLLRSQMVTGGS